MSVDFEMFVLAVVFASQIWVLSFLSPWQRRRSHEFIAERYPPADYPRLYPVPKEQLDRRFALFMPVHFTIGVACVVLLVVGLLRTGSPVQFGRWMYYGLLAQLLPLYLSMPWMLKVARAHRAMPPPAVRSVEMRQWRISDFVSPLWILLGLTFQVLALIATVLGYLRHLIMPSYAVFCGATSVVILARMLRVLLGPVPLARTDPYAAAPDQFRVRRQRFTLLFRMGTSLGAVVAFVVLYSSGSLHFDYGYVLAAVSILLQLLALRLMSSQARELRLRDFSVYRSDAASG
jgi:hypothetical protein